MPTEPEATAGYDPVTILAMELMEQMHRLDPDGSDADWSALSEPEKLFYESCVRHLLLFEDELLAALCADGSSPATTR